MFFTPHQSLNLAWITKVNIMLFTKNEKHLYHRLSPKTLVFSHISSCFSRKALTTLLGERNSCKYSHQELTTYFEKSRQFALDVYTDKENIWWVYSLWMEELIFGMRSNYIWNLLNLLLFFLFSRFCINQEPQMVRITPRATTVTVLHW